MPYATVPDGVRLYYKRARPSAGAGPAVPLLMGLGTNGRVWEPMVRRLTAAGYEVVTLDNRGSGRSSSPRLPWTTRTMAADAVGVLDALGIDRAHVIGASLGGMIAQELALAFPERVRTLGLGCTTGGLPRVDLMPRRGLWHIVLAASRHATWRRQRRPRMPVQVQHGTADRVIPFAAGRELARAIPTAELEVIDGAGHALVLECPDEIFERAQRFLTAHEAAV